MSDATQERRPAGEPEAALWAADEPLTAARVQAELDSGLARTTVTTILSRLHEKGTLERERRGRGYACRPVQDQHGLTALRMHGELARDTDRETVLARFVARLSPDDEQILRRLPEEGL
ncbi:BlaI/MecI/CopY family transcriptional regulator [Streptomyces sp. WELS2]|uniref:BlaI/MecI/CopY family transcriptional regulator n=1 Tax=Streptomyces sp. WELS2 TaxID=2749435 RepID=UPI0015F11B96|nr:BlaI/MecI/CopY family transcriptional regulator [Streptomyces sp. WELS2]